MRPGQWEILESFVFGVVARQLGCPPENILPTTKLFVGNTFPTSISLDDLKAIAANIEIELSADDYQFRFPTLEYRNWTEVADITRSIYAVMQREQEAA